MVTGWKKLSGNWYYFQSNGAMFGKGWHKIGSHWYYMYDSGAIATNTWVGNDYFDNSGAWVPGKTRYQQGWVKNGTRWWYRHSDGSYTKNGWEKINGQYYLFDSSGYMLTGWQKVKGTWYYLQSSGAMMGQGWHQINGNWYYMYSSGAMAANTWIGNYYVNASGVRSEAPKEYDLLEVCPPYQTSASILSNFSMGGTKYSSGISCSGYALYNFGKNYTTLSFDLGHRDDYFMEENQTLSIYLDNKLVRSIDLDPWALPGHYTVNVSGAQQLKISGSTYAGVFALGNLKVR